jgi:group I intron endonuclease
VYFYQSIVTNKIYIGITNNVRSRRASHLSSTKRGIKTPFYDAVRKYGCKGFRFKVVGEYPRNVACELEKWLIKGTTEINYNLTKGGDGGFNVPYKKLDAWKGKLSAARVGRTPSLGMKHTSRVKQVCREAAMRRWDGCRATDLYPSRAFKVPYKEASVAYNIPKTTYYRQKKREP